MSNRDATNVPSEVAVRAWQLHAGLSDSPEGTLDWLTGGTLAVQFAETAARFPDRQAVSFPQEGCARTHGQLDDAAARLAGWLIAQGIKPGDRAILCGYNSLAFVIAYVAILRAGGVVVLASPVLAAPELAHIVDDSGAVVAFCDHASGATFNDSVRWVVRLDEPFPEGPFTTPVVTHDDAMALLAYTSGTTGTPKAVQLTHANLLASVRAVTSSWHWTSSDVVFHALPLSHQHGLSGVHAALLTGSSATILRTFDSESFVQMARDCRATVLFAVPIMYERLLSAGAALDTLLVSRGGALRLAVSGSAPLSEELFGRLAERFGEPVLERYGTTETGLDVNNPYDGPRLAGCIGLPLPGVDVRVVGPDGTAVSSGENGELLLRGPQVCSSYWNNPQATQDAFDDDGWFRTGDVAQFDADSGYLRITGRKKELIISGGYNVYPREVEMAIESHPAVVEAAVAGIASTKWGEEVVAWVVVRDGVELDATQLLAHAKARLASYKCPKRFAFVESLPHNNLGKLLRSELPVAQFQTQSDHGVAPVHE